MKTQGLEFSGSTMINQPIFLQPTKKQISVKDDKGFDNKYVIYEETTACAVSGFILMAEERALERAKRFKQSKTVQRELASILGK